MIPKFVVPPPGVADGILERQRRHAGGVQYAARRRALRYWISIETVPSGKISSYRTFCAIAVPRDAVNRIHWAPHENR